VVAYTLFPPFVAFVLAWFFDHRISGWRSSLAEGVQLWIDAPFTRNEVMLRMVTVIAVVWLLMAMVRRVFFRLRRRAISGWILVPLSIGLVLLGWAIRGIWPWAIDTLLAAALPIIGFTVLSFGEFLLITQAGMGAAMGDDYVVTAFAKGVAPQRIRDVHVGRNASLVVMTRLAVSLPYLMTGLVIIETALAWPGVGSFMFRAIESQDLPAVMSGLAVVGILALLIRLFLDAASAWADPRIKDGLAEAVTG
jgi:ABC-type dipeptide/oligopeptide/nickel transport system permease component